MEIDPTQSQPRTLRQKLEALRVLSSPGSISTSIYKLSGSSRVLPSEKDFHFYYNFDEFRAPIDEISAMSQSMLQQIGSEKHFWGGKEMDFPQRVDDDDAYDWLVNVNDEFMERFDISLDEFLRLRKAEEEGARYGSVVDENGFQLVRRKKKKAPCNDEMTQREENMASSVVRVAERDKKTVGPKKPKVPFHIPTIKKPQEELNILVHNSNEPFQHVWLERSEDGSRFIHPLASRVLQLERNSLEYLLHHFCGVVANKEYQNADWRLRPLPDEMLRYAREDTHYLLYIYDLMRLRLVSESVDPVNSDALLVEVYKRSYDVCMQLYDKELLTDTSYLYVYGVQGANLNAQQLAIVAGLCEWRDSVARAEDESTGYILPNKALLEIAKQMPLTASKLRRLIRSRHLHVERNLSSVVNIIKNSIQNASSFEVVAEQLKEGCIQGPELNTAGADISEVQIADENSVEGSDRLLHECVLAPLQSIEETCKLTGNKSEHGKDGGVSFDYVVQHTNIRKGINGSSAPELHGECLASPSQENEKYANAACSQKAAEATVQVVKKPCRAFRSLLGNSSSKKKTNLRKEKEEDKLEEIKSSVNLPFYSFLHRDQQSKLSPKQAPDEPIRTHDSSLTRRHLAASALSTNSEVITRLDSDQQSNQAPEEPHRTSDALLPEECCVATALSTKSDDIILFDSDSNDEPADSLAGNENIVNSKDHLKTLEPGFVLDEDKDNNDEPMSLSDLSSNFRKCLKFMNQNQVTKQDDKSNETGLLQFKPFDYDAARKVVKFGDDAEKEVKNGNIDGEKNWGKKKCVNTGRNKQDEGILPQGRRCQAFPASGNRSATFR